MKYKFAILCKIWYNNKWWTVFTPFHQKYKHQRTRYYARRSLWQQQLRCVIWASTSQQPFSRCSTTVMCIWKTTTSLGRLSLPISSRRIWFTLKGGTMAREASETSITARLVCMRKSLWSSPTATAGKKLPVTALATNCLQKRNIFLTRKGEFSFYYKFVKFLENF